MEPIQHSRPTLVDQDIAAIVNLFKDGMIAHGLVAREFRARLCEFLGVEHVFLTPSGTVALSIALRALPNVSHGEVVIPSYVCGHVAEAVADAGANVVFADVGPHGVLTPATVAKVKTDDTAAVVAVNLFGVQCDVEGLLALGIPVVEDACQSFGSSERGVYSGTRGTVGVFSFHATKLLTTAEGGAVCTSDEKAAERLAQLGRVHGRMSDIQAGLGISQLSRFPEFAALRLEQLRVLLDHSYDLGLDVPLPHLPGSVPFRFLLRHSVDFDHLQNLFSERGISVRRGVDQLLHRNHGFPDLEFPSSVALFDSVFSLPFYPSLGADDRERIMQAMRDFREKLA